MPNEPSVNQNMKHTKSTKSPEQMIILSSKTILFFSDSTLRSTSFASVFERNHADAAIKSAFLYPWHMTIFLKQSIMCWELVFFSLRVAYSVCCVMHALQRWNALPKHNCGAKARVRVPNISLAKRKIHSDSHSGRHRRWRKERKRYVKTHSPVK